MKRYITRLSLAAVLAATSFSLEAQTLQSGYFVDNYLYRYQANPAVGNEGKGFVSMPGLGNLNITTGGTLSLRHIFYNLNGRTTTLLNPGISASEVLDGMKEHSRIGLDLRETILAVGFKALGGYNTITLGARANLNVGLPKELVRLAKQGVENSVYDLSDFGATARGWAEIALNHSHKINNKWRVGGTFKFLIGVGSLDAHVNTANLKLYDDQYIGEVDATAHTSIKGFNWKTDFNDRTNRHYVSGMDIDGFSPVNGFGAALDLGAVFTLNKDWEFSLAFTDLGFISWNTDFTATTDGLQSVSTDSFAFNVDNSDSWDKFTDNLTRLYELEDKGNLGSRLTGIGATMTAGAQFTLPVYRKLKFGFLNTTRINGDFSWTDFRLSATVRPVKVFSAGINAGYGTFGARFGGIINVNVTGFNLFVASDCFPGKFAKQYVPLNSNFNVNFGINFPF